MRHGLTMGELARLFNREMKIEADLRIIPLEGWSRSWYVDQIDSPWIPPSPNMPALSTALVYPGQVLLEGTNLSEGRGTTRPFEIFGAPFLAPSEISTFLQDTPLPGVGLIELAFRPTFQKWQGQECRGFFLWVYDRVAYKPYRTSLTVLRAIRRLYPKDFQWKSPPYEYETEHWPIDLLIGNREIRQALEAGVPIIELEASWQDELNGFMDLRKQYLIYG
jgi:uncharacterized protein YbbC (DUF1343 family)